MRAKREFGTLQARSRPASCCGRPRGRRQVWCRSRATPAPPRSTPGRRCPRTVETLRDCVGSRAGLGSWLSLPSAPTPPPSSSCHLQPSSAKAPFQSCMRSLPTPGATGSRPPVARRRLTLDSSRPRKKARKNTTTTTTTTTTITTTTTAAATITTTTTTTVTTTSTTTITTVTTTSTTATTTTTITATTSTCYYDDDDYHGCCYSCCYSCYYYYYYDDDCH